MKAVTLDQVEAEKANLVSRIDPNFVAGRDIRVLARYDALIELINGNPDSGFATTPEEPWLNRNGKKRYDWQEGQRGWINDRQGKVIDDLEVIVFPDPALTFAYIDRWS